MVCQALLLALLSLKMAGQVAILMTMNSPAAAASGTFWLPMPGEGILVRTNLYVDLTDVESIMVIYG
jgi:hypothetical protein